VLAGDLAVMTIKMNSANDQVGEVVVVGAGTQRKVSVTGAITSISGDELEDHLLLHLPMLLLENWQVSFL
jgi:hypothetical protein